MSKLKEEQEKLEEQIWRIRDDISTLEQVKDKILNYFNSDNAGRSESAENSSILDGPLYYSADKVENTTKRMWVKDIKETYYMIVSAWQMLNACPRNEGKKRIEKAKSCIKFLRIAESAFGQSASELEILTDDEAKKLNKAWADAFQKCKAIINEAVDIFMGKEKPVPPKVNVKKINDNNFQLLCGVCGAVAVEFSVGKTWYHQNPGVLYTGIVKSTALHINHAESIMKLLEAHNIAELHKYLHEYMCYEGIDAYCPKCNKVYCSEHYRTREVWDEGFYDCTYGWCPEGHKRMIDD
ncbi:MAG: hypothetical protein GF364_04360 [Candidatus Lokiarchaeota archaeon]|nr:hypothetical protein [Candidatus Lokiarchaeota archaeon]